MDREEVRSILSAYRVGESFGADARFEAARAQAETDPTLAQWWHDEQKLDQAIARKLQGMTAPAALKARLLEADRPSVPRWITWPRKIATIAAAIVLLAVFFGSWRGLFQPASTLADYRDEMVGFVRLDPALDLQTSEMPRVAAFLKESGAPADVHLPERLRELKPVGCRTLRFRGQDVSLICFLRDKGELVHLLVVNRKTMGKMSNREDPQFAAEGDWMTAAWADGDQAYLLATKGNREALAKYFGTS